MSTATRTPASRPARSTTPAGGARLGVLAVLVATAGLGLAYGVGYTITAVQFEAWGTPAWMAGLAGAAPSVAVLLMVPFAPMIGARVGTARAMVLGAGIAIASYALMPLMLAPEAWLVLRFLAGVGLTLPWLLGETWINLATPDAVRGRVLAAYTVALFGAWALAPELLMNLGSSPTTASTLGVLGMAVAVLPLTLARRLAPRLASAGPVRPLRALRLAPFAMAASLVGGIAEFSTIALLPTYGLRAGLTQDQVLRLLTLLLVGGIVLLPGLGWLADRVDRRRMLGGLGLALSVLGTTLGATIHDATLAGVVVFALGGVVMGFYAVGLTLLGEQVPAHRMVLANAAFLIAYEAGATGGPLVAGAAIDAWPAFGLAGILVVTGVAYAASVLRRPAAGRHS